MDPKKYTTNISGYRCNADRKKIQVRVEGATNVCKKLCYDDPDCKGYYTKQPAHFNRNTVCNLCTGKAKNPILKRSSNVNDYSKIAYACDENYKLSEDGTNCINLKPCPENTYGAYYGKCMPCPAGQIAPADSKRLDACKGETWEIEVYGDKHVGKQGEYIHFRNERPINDFKKEERSYITLILDGDKCLSLYGKKSLPPYRSGNKWDGRRVKGMYFGTNPRDTQGGRFCRRGIVNLNGTGWWPE